MAQKRFKPEAKAPLNTNEFKIANSFVAETKTAWPKDNHYRFTTLQTEIYKGRGLVAQKPFKEGDIIFTEKPLVCAQFSWNELYKYKACEYCLKSLETAEDMARRLAGDESLVLPHPECCDVDTSAHVVCPQCQALYCSTSCQGKAMEQYHQVLCLGPSREDPEHPINKIVNEWRSFHYPPETASVMLIIKMIAMVKQAKDKDAVICNFARFVQSVVNESEHIPHKLLGEKFKVQMDILRTMVTDAFYEEAVQEWFTPEGFNSVFALIGTNGQGIGSSSFSQWVKATESLPLGDVEKTQLDDTIEMIYDKFDEVSGNFLDCEGSGLYCLQSTANHSCSPNAEITFPQGDNTISMVALADIEPEEEITISYLGCCDVERSRHSRQKALRENYLFTCCCLKCLSQADDASETSDDDDDDDNEMEDEEEM